MNITVENFINSLPIIGKGYLGVFIVTIVIIAAVYILGAISSGLEKKKNGGDKTEK